MGAEFAEFAVVMAELQAEVKVEMGAVEKGLISVEFDSAEVMAAAEVVVSAGFDSAEVMAAVGVVVYVGSVAAAVVAVVGLLENCTVAAVEGLAQAAVTAEIEVAVKDVGIGVDVVV